MMFLRGMTAGETRSSMFATVTSSAAKLSEFMRTAIATSSASKLSEFMGTATELGRSIETSWSTIVGTTLDAELTAWTTFSRETGRSRGQNDSGKQESNSEDLHFELKLIIHCKPNAPYIPLSKRHLCKHPIVAKASEVSKYLSFTEACVKRSLKQRSSK